jgi:hypothetical protein
MAPTSSVSQVTADELPKPVNAGRLSVIVAGLIGPRPPIKEAGRLVFEAIKSPVLGKADSKVKFGITMLMWRIGVGNN